MSIDENSLRDAQRDALGQYRFERSIYARLIDRLAEGGATVVALDLQFPANSADPRQDDALVRSLKRLPAILSYSLIDGEAGPIAPKLAAAAQLGYTPVHNESGPVAGQTLTEIPDRSSLVIRAAEAYTHEQYSPIAANRGQLGRTHIPLDGSGRFLLVPFETESTTPLEQSTGSPSQWIDFAPSIEFADVLRLTPAELHDFFAGTLVVVGPTAHGVADFVDTPRGRIPSVFTTLRLIDQLISRTSISTAPPALNIFVIAVFTIIVAAAGYFLSPIATIVVAAVAFVGWTLFTLTAFALNLYWIDTLHVDLAILATTLVVGLYRGILERNDRRRITEILEKHTSPEVAHNIIDAELTDSRTALQGKRATVTIFYSDIRGFTSLAEEMDPEALYTALNEYFEEMCAIIFKHGGYVDKFMGDALMAVFSAPNQTPDDPRNAVIAALEQLDRLAVLNRRWTKMGRPAFEIGVGINTGLVVMGEVGSHERLNYTVIGDAVNVASRLQASAQRGQIVVGESTAAEIIDDFDLCELESIIAKGKSQPVRTFSVLGRAVLSDEKRRISAIVGEAITGRGAVERR